jgi:malonate-semialdehyde dehydrogenase (acetylating)/methylmalonate-semialdehyde dehydrogenase
MTVSTPAVPLSPVQSAASVPFWIDGRRAAAHSTRLGEVTNPSTGAVIRTVSMADAADIDTAVRSARAALPEWCVTPPLRRARILTRFRELLESHQKELAALISEEHGKVFLDAMGSVQRGIEVVEFASGAPHLLKGAFSESVGRGVDSYSLHGAAVDVPPGPGLRQLLHPQTIREGSVAVDTDGGIAQRGGTAGRRLQCRAR